MERKKLLDVILAEAELSAKARKLTAFFLLLASDIIFCIPFRGWGNIFGFIPWYTSLSLAPDLLSGFIALAFVIPLYWRRILELRLSIFGILMSVLTVFLAASYVKMLLTGGAFDSFGLAPGVKYSILLASVLLSWMGLRLFAGLGFCLVFLLAIFNVISVNNILGIWGFVIIVCTFLGVLLQTSFSGFGEFMEELAATYKKPAVKVMRDMKDGARAAASALSRE